MWCDVLPAQQMPMHGMWPTTCQRSRLPSCTVRTMRLNIRIAQNMPLPSLLQDSLQAQGMSQPLHSQHSKFACRQSACSPEFTFELSSVRPVHIRPQQLPLPCMRQISQHCRGMRSTRWHYGCHSTSVSSMPSDVVSPSKLYVPPLWIGSHGGPRMSRSDSERRFTAAGRNSNWQSRSARA
jgi:hypothetical protein